MLFQLNFLKPEDGTWQNISIMCGFVGDEWPEDWADIITFHHLTEKMKPQAVH